jgi:hypothetical protein
MIWPDAFKQNSRAETGILLTWIDPGHQIEGWKERFDLGEGN